MLDDPSLVSHPHHNLLKALSLQDKMAVLMAESQVASCLQRLALHVICSTTNELLYSTHLTGPSVAARSMLLGDEILLLAKDWSS